MCPVPREPHRERGENKFPRCALIRGMHETSYADWWDARVPWRLTPLFCEALYLYLIHPGDKRYPKDRKLKLKNAECANRGAATSWLVTTRP